MGDRDWWDNPIAMDYTKEPRFAHTNYYALVKYALDQLTQLVSDKNSYCLWAIPLFPTLVRALFLYTSFNLPSLDPLKAGRNFFLITF